VSHNVELNGSSSSCECCRYCCYFCPKPLCFSLCALVAAVSDLDLPTAAAGVVRDKGYC